MLPEGTKSKQNSVYLQDEPQGWHSNITIDSPIFAFFFYMESFAASCKLWKSWTMHFYLTHSVERIEDILSMSFPGITERTKALIMNIRMSNTHNELQSYSQKLDWLCFMLLHLPQLSFSPYRWILSNHQNFRQSVTLKYISFRWSYNRYLTSEDTEVVASCDHLWIQQLSWEEGGGLCCTIVVWVI